jgi:hypothetical protein
MIAPDHSNTMPEVYRFICNNIKEVQWLGGNHCHLVVIIDHMQQLAVGPDI